MQEYGSKQALIAEIEKTAEAFIKEFAGIPETDKDKLFDGVDRTPAQMLAYQLGWLNLVMGWDRDEAAGRPVAVPREGYKWNQMGALNASFYREYQAYSLVELQAMFQDSICQFVQWVESFTEDELFTPGSRKWASTTPSNWPVWKWVHINSVAPFKSFRSKVRKWKRLNAGS